MKSSIQAHCTEKFFGIISRDGISIGDLMNSLNIETNRHMVFMAGEGAGASGSFFFFS
jgi:hypothetical protein